MKADIYNTLQPHDDPMVITVQISNCVIHRVLVNIDNSVDILFKDTLEKLNLKHWCYNNCTTLLYSFTEDSIILVGSNILKVIAETVPLQQNIMTNFVMVVTPTYKMILGRPFLSSLKEVLSVYHNILMVLVGGKVGKVLGDQKADRKCYAVSANPTILAKQFT
ncbi:hypothetical protein Ddye_016023 [Dipteronia dyeriana]|uniref:Uncharacterized protein n=1 Tax=Dipteronia dyeriana TaxID=168575 RepID=A0AAD9U6J0_9ROSI|nr:hypothetical protein Ddye_016023 [Dipteronia dyeriana]